MEVAAAPDVVVAEGLVLGSPRFGGELIELVGED